MELMDLSPYKKKLDEAEGIDVDEIRSSQEAENKAQEFSKIAENLAEMANDEPSPEWRGEIRHLVARLFSVAGDLYFQADYLLKTGR